MPTDQSHHAESVYLIACGVLKPDIAAVLGGRTDIAVTTNYLPGGLHSDPPELRRRIQQAVDEAEGRGFGLIVLGYGICGRGSIGIHARSIPIVIPKVHDCIALFLGSDRRYREEFRKFPGTYYISAGWYREKVQPKGVQCDCSTREVDRRRKEELAETYGAENAGQIVDFLNSWRENYQRAAFIDTGASGKERYASYAKAMAEEFGWRYERIAGTHELLEKLFDLQQHHPEVLVVPPNHVTAYDAKRQSLAAAWVEERAGGAAPADQGTARRETAAPPETAAPADQGADGHAAPTDGRRVGAEGASFADNGAVRRKTTARPETAARGGEAHFGLGIDAGGTYTDAVVFDFRDKRVLCAGKALTTKWDYSVGIMNAVDQLDASLFPSVHLTAISTTLATNAIVEGKGQPVGLILIPSSFYDASEIHHEPTAVVSGSLDISGRELEPIDAQEVRGVVREMVAQGVEAFAVSGYAASVNPSQELRVKRIIREETDRAVCLGSELSELLNFHVRANTAVLNAKILPLLESFMADVEKSLLARNITSPVMVVRGDGSLMTDRFAADHPVETVMSGPAASVAGARYLTKREDALVIDVGGTTSDIGRISAGGVAVRDAGSKVGRWRTHVRAVDMKTEGIGGDSEIGFEKRVLTVGPARVEPISLLAVSHDVEPALDYLVAHVDDFASSTRPMKVYALTARPPEFELTEAEARVYRLLQHRPYSLRELAVAAGAGHWSLLRMARLRDSYCVQESGLTPTDLLHVGGRVTLFRREAAERLAAVFAEIVGKPIRDLTGAVFSEIRRGLVTAILEKQLETDVAGDPVGRLLVDRLTTPASSEIALAATLPFPLIGLGAAAPFFLDHTAEVFATELEIPEHAAVANAVGAITSLVSVKKSASIVPSDIGTYLVQGLPGAPQFEGLDEAYDHAVASLREDVAALARDAGTDEADVQIRTDDRISETAEGAEVFLERRVVATVTGAPAPR